MAFDKSLLFTGWKQLLKMYLASLAVGVVCGLLLIQVFHVPAELVFQLSSSRVAHAAAVFDAGVSLGIDQGVLIFVWNVSAAFVSMGFFFCFPLFDAEHRYDFPQIVRKMVLGQRPMKLLCYLPGCRSIERENLRRLYVWLMVPLLGIMLLGLESGLMMTVGIHSVTDIFLSFLAFLPHGIIEIPAFTLAGAVTFSGHLLVKNEVGKDGDRGIFSQLRLYRQTVNPVRLMVAVSVALLLAAMVEAHITTKLVQYLFT